MRRPKESRSTAPRELVSPELVERCKAGDELAWRELVEVTHREVYTLCLRILRNPDDAAEATQDAYLKAWRALKGFRGDAMFTTWLYRVAANTAISKHRSRKRRRSHETGVGDELLGQIAATGSTEGAVATRFEMAALERALALLPEHYRSAVVLRDVYGLSIKEIASQLKISSTAAKVRVHRGRKKLKEMVFTNGTEEEV
ncbi:MAG: RNA polymerase sigma factor [Actinomycetota bacterium]|nr:RNA polymerase sigma factor [Actinomycetota bacterium]